MCKQRSLMFRRRLAAALVSLGAAGGALAQSVTFTPTVLTNPEIQDGTVRWGLSLGIVPDRTGDGRPELAVGTPFLDTGEMTHLGIPLNVGRIWMVDPATGGSVIQQFDDPEAEEFGKFGRVAVTDDLNGDGINDLFSSVYFRSEVGGYIGFGEAYIYNGADGGILAEVYPAEPQPLARFGCYVIALNDCNGDGVSDVATCSPFQDVGGVPDVGEVYIYSGADGYLIRTISHPGAPVPAKFGLFLARAGDLSPVPDGVDDIIIGSPGEQKVYVADGATGAILLTISTPEPTLRALFGRVVASGRDVNGDGKNDIAVAAQLQRVGDNWAQGRVYLYSGANGQLIRTIKHPTPQAFAQFGAGLALIPDMDGDGNADVLVGAPDQDVSDVLNVGQAWVISSATGKSIATLNNPMPQPFSQFGAPVHAADFNLDGIADPVIGAPLVDLQHGIYCMDNHMDQGIVVIFMSSLGASGK